MKSCKDGEDKVPVRCHDETILDLPAGDGANLQTSRSHPPYLRLTVAFSIKFVTRRNKYCYYQAAKSF
jgi:hypothetical protein